MSKALVKIGGTSALVFAIVALLDRVAVAYATVGDVFGAAL